MKYINAIIYKTLATLNNLQARVFEVSNYIYNATQEPDENLFIAEILNKLEDNFDVGINKFEMERLLRIKFRLELYKVEEKFATEVKRAATIWLKSQKSNQSPQNPPLTDFYALFEKTDLPSWTKQKFARQAAEIVKSKIQTR